MTFRTHQWENSKIFTVECQTGFQLGRCSVMFKKKKIIYFHFYLVSKYKKKVKILTPIISNETMQSNLVYTTIISTPSPLQFCYFIQLWLTENWVACAWLENFTCLLKRKPHAHETPQQLLRIVATLCLQVNL